jgi:hypothetical protein
MTTDRGIHAQISDLVAQERELRTKLEEHEIAPEEERARLDLLRQRQALRDAGGDPAAANVRPADEVEGYLG